MHNKQLEPMTAEKVEQFDVRIFDSRDLVVSVVPLQTPWRATAESYEVSSPYSHL